MAYGSTLGSDAAGRAATAAWGREVLSAPDWASSNDPVGFGGQWGYRYQGGGLSLLGHRYYDATTGRFLTRDPLGYSGGINLYGFAGNNPVTGMDPEGTDGEDSNPMAYLNGLFSHATPADWAAAFRDSPVTKALQALGNAALNAPLPDNPVAEVRVGEEATEAVKTFITYAIKDREGEVVYVGKARGVGTLEKVLKERLSKGTLKSRLSGHKGHDHYFPKNGDTADVIAVQGNADASAGAEIVWYERYRLEGAKLRNDQPIGSMKSGRVKGTLATIQAYNRDLMSR